MKIYTLIINDKYGTNIFNFMTEDELNAELFSYVEARWCGERDISGFNQEEAIEQYFYGTLCADDWYRAEEWEVPLGEAFNSIQSQAEALKLIEAAPMMLNALRGSIQSFHDSVRTTEALSEFPHLQACIDAVNAATIRLD